MGQNTNAEYQLYLVTDNKDYGLAKDFRSARG